MLKFDKMPFLCDESHFSVDESEKIFGAYCKKFYICIRIIRDNISNKDIFFGGVLV
jgi:hypothetical protein